MQYLLTKLTSIKTNFWLKLSSFLVAIAKQSIYKERQPIANECEWGGGGVREIAAKVRRIFFNYLFPTKISIMLLFWSAKFVFIKTFISKTIPLLVSGKRGKGGKGGKGEKGERGKGERGKNVRLGQGISISTGVNCEGKREQHHIVAVRFRWIHIFHGFPSQLRFTDVSTNVTASKIHVQAVSQAYWLSWENSIFKWILLVVETALVNFDRVNNSASIESKVSQIGRRTNFFLSFDVRGVPR